MTEMFRKVFSTTLILLTLFSTLVVVPVHAAGKFETTITRDYYLQEDLSVKVVEKETIVNNTSSLYIPSGSSKEFDILAIEQENADNIALLKQSAKSIVLKYDNKSLSYTSEIDENAANLHAKFPYNLNPGQKITFSLEYTHYGLMEQNGALRDFFLNGFSSDSVFSDSNNQTIYKTNVHVPASFAGINFALPDSSTSTKTTSEIIYTFTQQDLVDNYVWIQFGRTQYYQFNINQKIYPSENINTGNKNTYELILPRDIDEARVSQKVFFESFSPTPSWIRQDGDGNLVAGYKFPSNEQIDIEIQGFASISKQKDSIPSALGVLSDIGVDMEGYLAGAEYWEVDDPKIKSQISNFKKSDDIYEIIENTYKFVVDRIDYSEVKRFGINERQGAVATLEGGAAVCMEYSDLFLTLMRAQGVPTRAAFGYGYDPKTSEDSQEAHQWVEVYSPEIDEWISVDVTWGENGDALIGGDLNHFYTHVASISPNDPSQLTGQGVGSLRLDSPKFEISVSEKLSTENSSTQEDLLQMYPYNSSDLGEDALERIDSKLNATFSNLVSGETLAMDQIVILVLGGMLFVMLVFGGVGVVKRQVFARRRVSDL